MSENELLDEAAEKFHRAQLLDFIDFLNDEATRDHPDRSTLTPEQEKRFMDHAEKYSHDDMHGMLTVAKDLHEDIRFAGMILSLLHLRTVLRERTGEFEK